MNNSSFYRLITLIAMTMTIVIIYGCQMQEVTPVEDELTSDVDQGVILATIAGSICADSTKTVLNTEHMYATWNNQDYVSISAIGSQTEFLQKKYIVDGGATTTKARLQYAYADIFYWPSESSHYFAIYPFQNTATITGTGDDRVMNMYFPIEQGILAEDFIGGVLVSRKQSAGYPSSLTFNNLFSIIKLPITGPTGTLLKSVIFKDNSGKPVAGDYSIKMILGSQDSGEPLFPNTAANTAYQSITFDLGEGIALSGTPQYIYVLVPPRNYANGFTFTFVANNGQVMTKTKSSAKNIEMGKYYTMASVNFSANNTTVDLSRDGTANCYIVNGAGSYTFNADVIGNGVNGMLSSVPQTQKHFEYPTDQFTAIDPQSASLLWQDVPGLIENLSFNNSTNTVCFTTSAKKGNALIAVYDNDTKILWSWHIWCTDTPVIQSYTNFAGNNYSMMDRNLGATVAFPYRDDESIVATFGLHYQWGRKDPFPSFLTYFNTEMRPLYNIEGDEANQIFNKEHSTKSISGTFQNPTTFYANSRAYDWITSDPNKHNDYLWGNPNGNTQYLNFYDDVTDLTIVPEKTIYDPCPPGYRVPPYDIWTRLSTNGESHYDTDGYLNKSGEYNMAGYNLFIQEVGSGVTAWFPTGYRSGNFYHESSYGYLVLSLGYYWTSSNSGIKRGSVEYAYGRQFATALRLYYDFSLKKNCVSPAFGCDKANGGYVRCMKE